MKAPKKTYVGAAVVFERVADDGWPEDAGLWPIDGRTPRPVNGEACVRGIRWPPLSQFTKPLLRRGDQT
jgi:hypothetical protein